MATVAGVDAYKKGWVAVVLEEGTFKRAHVFPTIGDLLSNVSDAAVVGIDIPIGLPASGRRMADTEASAFVGPRRSSVFWTPPRAVLEAETYDEARRVAKAHFGFGVSSQAYRGLRKKILEVDAVIGDDDRLIEIHPECPSGLSRDTTCTTASEPGTARWSAGAYSNVRALTCRTIWAALLQCQLMTSSTQRSEPGPPAATNKASRRACPIPPRSATRGGPSRSGTEPPGMFDTGLTWPE